MLDCIKILGETANDKNTTEQLKYIKKEKKSQLWQKFENYLASTVIIEMWIWKCDTVYYIIQRKVKLTSLQGRL